MRLSLMENEQYSELSKKLKGHNAILTNPVKLRDGFFKQIYHNMNHYNSKGENYLYIEGLFITMIFNPFGPTINLTGIVSNEVRKIELIYHRSLNPFSCSSHILASCDHSYEMNIIKFFQNLFSGKGFNDFQPYKTMPTFIFPLKEDLFEYAFSITNELYTGVEENISEFNGMMKKNLGNPWDLATMQLNKAAKDRSKNKVEGEFEYNEEYLNDYFELVFNKQNVDAHLKSLPLAWQGAIKHAPGALCELNLETLLKELIYSGCTIFAGKLD